MKTPVYRKKYLSGLIGGVVIALPQVIQACPVCLGNADAPMTRGLSIGILFMLGILILVFGGVAGFVFFLAKKGPSITSESADLNQDQESGPDSPQSH